MISVIFVHKILLRKTPKVEVS